MLDWRLVALRRADACGPLDWVRPGIWVGMTGFGVAEVIKWKRSRGYRVRFPAGADGVPAIVFPPGGARRGAPAALAASVLSEKFPHCQ